MRLGSSNQAIHPKRPRPLATIGISWHLMASAGHSSGRPPGPQSGLAKQAKHNQAAAVGAPTGGALLPLLSCPRASAVVQFLGLPTKLFVSFLAVLPVHLLVFQRWPDSALPAAAPFPWRSPGWIVDANPLELMLLLFPFASRVETVGRCQCRCRVSARCPIDWVQCRKC